MQNRQKLMHISQDNYLKPKTSFLPYFGLIGPYLGQIIFLPYENQMYLCFPIFHGSNKSNDSPGMLNDIPLLSHILSEKLIFGRPIKNSDQEEEFKPFLISLKQVNQPKKLTYIKL